MEKSLVLASTSPFRKELLNRFNIPFEACTPEVNEEEYKRSNTAPEELACLLAELKATSLKDQFSKATIIGSDQVLDLNGEVFSKPGNQEKAKKQLKLLQGKKHKLITAVCIVEGELKFTFSSIAILKMRELSDNEIENYVKADNPIHCAGSYKLESLGITLFETINCEDYTSIIGLPLMELANQLRCRGWKIP